MFEETHWLEHNKQRFQFLDGYMPAPVSLEEGSRRKARLILVQRSCSQSLHQNDVQFFMQRQCGSVIEQEAPHFVVEPVIGCQHV